MAITDLGYVVVGKHHFDISGIAPDFVCLVSRLHSSIAGEPLNYAVSGEPIALAVQGVIHAAVKERLHYSVKEEQL